MLPAYVTAGQLVSCVLNYRVTYEFTGRLFSTGYETSISRALKNLLRPSLFLYLNTINARLK